MFVSQIDRVPFAYGASWLMADPASCGRGGVLVESWTPHEAEEENPGIPLESLVDCLLPPHIIVLTYYYATSGRLRLP